MSLDSKTIETLSVNAVKNSIVMTEYLDQFISDNDKEPSWDGFIYIYKNESKKKSDLEGRVAVQVKGTENNDHSKDEISFSMQIADLNNYLNDGGCVLFVVYIGNNGAKIKIYYSELTPLKLRSLLHGKQENKSRTVTLKKFPDDNIEKATVLRNFLQNCKKQASFTESELYTVEELENKGVLESLEIPFSGFGKIDPENILLKNELYMYAKIKGSDILHPIELISENILHTQRVINKKISINDKIFYNDYKVIKSKNTNVSTLCIGHSLKMEFNENTASVKIKYKNSNKMRIVAKDLDFILNCFKEGYFNIDDKKIPFKCSEKNFDKFDMEKAEEHLSFAKKVVEVLDFLGCTDDIDINDMKDEDWNNLKYLITAFFDKKPVEGLKSNLNPFTYVEIGKLKIAIILKEIDESGKYEFCNYFNTYYPIAIDDINNSGNLLPVSQYCLLGENDFLTLSNIDFDVLLPSFKKEEYHYDTFNRASIFLLDLLKACDKANGIRKEKLLKTCKEFSEWILEEDKNELDYPIKELNALQTIKRYREFREDEIEKLYDIVENRDVREDCIVGAYLLLDQQQAAERHFAKLSEEEQEIFREYPIYHFWKEKH